MNKVIILRYIVFFFISIMCVQYVPIEGPDISLFKFGAMIICPFILFLNFSNFTRGIFICFLYVLSFSFSSFYNFESFRLSTYGYKLSYLIMLSLIHI